MLSVTPSGWLFKITTPLLPGRFNNFYAESTVSDPIIYTFESRPIICYQPAAEVRQSRALHPTPPSEVAVTQALGDLLSINSEHIDERTKSPLPRTTTVLDDVTPPSEVAVTQALDDLLLFTLHAHDDATNDPSTADRTAVVPPARTPKRKSNYSLIAFSSPSFVDDTLPTVSPLRDTSTVAMDVSIPSPPSPSPLASFPNASTDTAKPTTAPIRPKPRPAYQLALPVRAAAEAKEDTPVVETTANNSGDGAPPSHSVPPSPSRLLCRSPTPARPVTPQATSDVIDGEDHGGRRRRKLTAFGVMHAKEIEEKNERAAARKKADEEKGAVRGKGRGTRGRGRRRSTK